MHHHLLLLLCLVALSVADRRSKGITPEATNYLPNITVTPPSWTFTQESTVWSSPPTIVNDRVYFHTNAGVNSVSLLDGKLLGRNTKISARGTTIVNSPYADKSIIVEQYPSSSSTFQILDPISLEVRETIPKVNPGTVVWDTTGMYFVDQRIIYRYAFDGVLMKRRSISDQVDLKFGRIDQGIIGVAMSKLFLINSDLETVYSQSFFGLGPVHSVAVNSKTGHVIFPTYDYQQPLFIFIHGLDVNMKPMFKFNVTRSNNLAQVVFLTIQDNGSIVFGVGTNARNDVKLELYRIRYFGGSYLEPELVKTVVESGSYQGHVLFPSGKLALSVYDTSIDVWSTVVSVVDLNSMDSKVLAQHPNNKGLEMIGYAERCLLYTSKGVYNVPNRLHNICF
ncbi:hypothetical protein RCL1_001358 [Eukaryota sp. TZLM3-RCL]